MFKFKDREIFVGQGWTDDEGVRQPKNWNIWPDDYKAKMNITEIKEDARPDQRLYNWSMDENGKITSTPKDINVLKKDHLRMLKEGQRGIMWATDCYYIRELETGEAIPTKIKTWRASMRTRAKEMETAINACSSVEDLSKILVVQDKDGKVTSGILFDWPILEV